MEGIRSGRTGRRFHVRLAKRLRKKDTFADDFAAR
jgi:hypothetical protein